MATFVAACSQGQHMHSAQTKNKKNSKGGLLDKDWVTRHSGTIGHSVDRLSVDLELGPIGTGSHGHWGARHSVAPSNLKMSSTI